MIEDRIKQNILRKNGFYVYLKDDDCYITYCDKMNSFLTISRKEIISNSVHWLKEELSKMRKSKE